MDPQRFELCADQLSRIFDYDDYSIAKRTNDVTKF